MTAGTEAPDERTRRTALHLVLIWDLPVVAAVYALTRVDNGWVAWSNAGLPTVGALFLLAYFWGWGSLLLRLPPFRVERDLQDPLLVLMLGLGGAIVAIFLLGMAGLLYFSVFLPLSLGVIATGCALLPPWQVIRRQRAVSPERWTLWDALPAIAVGAVLLVVAGVSFLPDDSWDAAAYHLAMGKIYVQQGRIVYIPWLLHSNFPINGELLFLHGLLLEGDRLVAPLNVIFFALAAAAVFRIARLDLGRGPAFLAVLVFMLCPEIIAWVNTCDVEIIWTGFAITSLWCALRWKRSGEAVADRPDAWLYLAGIFAGLAAGTKFMGILSAAAIGVILMGFGADRRQGLGVWRPLLKYGVVFCIVASPGYLKSYVQTGTPLFPESLGVFDVRNYSSEIWGRNLEFGRSVWPGAPLTPSDFVLAAWEHRDDPSVALVVVFALATLVRWRRFSQVAPFFVFVAFHYAFWCYATHQDRFLIPALPAAVLGLMGLTYGSSRLLATRVLCTVFWLVTLTLSVRPLMAKYERFHTAVVPVVSGAIRREDLLRSNPLYVASRLVDGYTKPNARILLFQEVRGYFLDRDYLWGDPLNQGVLPYRELENAEQLRQAIQRLGVTHLLVGPQHFPFDIERRYARYDWELMEDLLMTLPRVFSTDEYVLYASDRHPLDPANRRSVVPSPRSDAFAQDGVTDGSASTDAWGHPLCQAD